MNEQGPVQDSEFVYRRIAPMYYDPALPVPVQREAFRPSQNDATSLSVLRANFAQPLDTLANLTPGKAQGYCVARLLVRDLQGLGLTVVPEPVPGGPPSHAVIPELSWAAYQANKNTWNRFWLNLPGWRARTSCIGRAEGQTSGRIRRYV